MLELIRFPDPPAPPARANAVSGGDLMVEGLDAKAADAAVRGLVARPAGTRVHARREEDGSWTVIFTRLGVPERRHD